MYVRWCARECAERKKVICPGEIFPDEQARFA